MKARYHIVQGEPNNDEREWNVLDREHVPCGLYCDGGVVFTATTRKAARDEATQLNAKPKIPERNPFENPLNPNGKGHTP